jgi:predicted AAA+ superfamily ATPase
MFPFSFKEYLDYKGIDAKSSLSTKQRLYVIKAFDEYWQTGGFPEVLGLSQKLRIKIHQEYYQAILFRDLVERHDVAHPKAITDLAHKLIDTTGSLYSINSLTGYLQSLNHNAPKSVISSYVDWFEDAYFLFTIRVFDASLSRSKSSPKKIYCIDHAFVTSISSGILVNSGHLLENLVFIALRRQSPSVYYYKTKSGREVDFIIQTEGRTKTLIQVCESLVSEQTKKREVDALLEAMNELGLSEGFIVTRNEEDRISKPTEDYRNPRLAIYDSKPIIHIIPIWRFLLKFEFKA